MRLSLASLIFHRCCHFLHFFPHDREEDLVTVGVVPKSVPPGWDYDVCHLYSYYLTANSKVRFLSQRYRFAYLLDLSPSAAGPNLSSRDTMVTTLLPVLGDSLAGLVRPFYVPGKPLN